MMTFSGITFTKGYHPKGRRSLRSALPTDNTLIRFVQIHTLSAELTSLCNGFSSRMRFVYKDFGEAYVFSSVKIVAWSRGKIH